MALLDVAAGKDRTYSNRSNCVAGARAQLGKAAKPGVDFEVLRVGDRLAWRPLTALAVRLAAAQEPAAVNGGLDAAASAPIAGGSAAATGVDDMPPIPPILALAPETPEAAAIRRASQSKTHGPDKELTMRKTSATRRGDKRTPAGTVARPDGLRAGSKMATMVDMVQRVSGATEPEICERIGWKACMVTLRRACESAGLRLEAQGEKRKEKTVWKASPKSDAKKRA